MHNRQAALVKRIDGWWDKHCGDIAMQDDMFIPQVWVRD